MRRTIPHGYLRLPRVPALAAALLVAVVTLVVAPAGLASQKSTRPAPERAAASMQLKVMEFNIEYDGVGISFEKVVEAVKRADPDILCLEEADTNGRWVARMAGFPYYSADVRIASKYPILVGDSALFAYVEVRPGYVVAFSNVHLPSISYGPYFMLLGRTADRLAASETRARVKALMPNLVVMDLQAQAGIPSFVVGDFNSPSLFDYTEATVGLRRQIKYPFAWPTSQAMADAGFRDSWREIHPDPVANPGITWPAKRPRIAGQWNPGKKALWDRIDYIYAAGSSTTLDSSIIGEKGGPEVSMSVSPWPSDHRALLSTFEVTPAVEPILVAVRPMMPKQGQSVRVTFNAPGNEGEQVALLIFGRHATADALAVQPTGGLTHGVLTFGTAECTPGKYSIMLFDAGGREILASIPFWIRSNSTTADLSTDKSKYKVGEPIVVTWKDAPATRWDWLGIYKASAADPVNDWYLLWQYCAGAGSQGQGGPDGSFTFEAQGHEGGPWPLPPGKYVVYYLLADGYKAVGKATFTVVK